jgi:solute carrier family 25 carnitine/acylcarnitine transporter 20/29
MIAGVVNALSFGVYQVIQSTFEQRYSAPSSKLPLWTHLFAGLGAGAAISVINSPAITLKVQQQALGEGLLATASYLVKAEGARGLFRGFGVHFVADTVGRGVYMMAYESLKRVSPAPSDKVPYAQRLLAGAGAGMSSWLLIYPADVVRSRLFALRPGEGRSLGFAACVQQVYRERGFRGFFKGLSLTVLTAGPIAAVVLPTYDFIFDFLQTSKLSLVLTL